VADKKFRGSSARCGPNVLFATLLLLIAGGYQLDLGCPPMRYLIEYRNGKPFRVPYGERTAFIQFAGNI